MGLADDRAEDCRRAATEGVLGLVRLGKDERLSDGRK
jgi:hypothetical protein